MLVEIIKLTRDTNKSKTLFKDMTEKNSSTNRWISKNNLLAGRKQFEKLPNGEVPKEYFDGRVLFNIGLIWNNKGAKYGLYVTFSRYYKSGSFAFDSIQELYKFADDFMRICKELQYIGDNSHFYNVIGNAIKGFSGKWT